MAKLSEKQKEEYIELKKKSEVISKRIHELENLPTVYGYARVSTLSQAKDGNSLEAQYQELTRAGAEEIFSDVFTGKKTDRPQLDLLLSKVKSGDTIIVTKFDRIARNLKEGIELIDRLNANSVKVNVLNMGVIDDSPSGTLIRNIMLSFAEWEREMIIQRTQEGKAIAKSKPGFKDGRPKKYSDKQLDHAMELLENHSYNQVVEITGISKSTLQREKRSRIR